jgi:hypothetical protein
MLQHHIVHLNMTKVDINIISKLNFVIRACIAKETYANNSMILKLKIHFEMDLKCQHT